MSLGSPLSPPFLSPAPVPISNLPKHRVMVLDFLKDPQSRTSPRVLAEVRRILVRELNRTGRFVVVSSTDLPRSASTYMGADGQYDMDALSKIGKSMGLAAIVEGRVLDLRLSQIGDSVGIFRQQSAEVQTKIRLRVASARNGRVILDDQREARAQSTSTSAFGSDRGSQVLEKDPTLVQNAVIQAVNQSIPDLIKSIEKISWEGRIASISGERVYINAGQLSGLRIGDILKITEEGEDIYDPDTGRYIGKAPGRMKGSVELVSFFGKDGSIAVYHSGSGFRENDRVELY